MSTACNHMSFEIASRVARLEDSGGFLLELKIACKDCGQAFQFLGLEPGLDLQGARVSIDGLEANIAITPVGTKPSPMQRMVYNIGKFDG